MSASERQTGADDERCPVGERAVTADDRAVTASAQPVPTNGAQSAPVSTPVVSSDQPVTAGIDQWRAIAQSLNGQRASVTADMIIDLLTERGMTAPSDSTVRRWARLTVNGEL